MALRSSGLCRACVAVVSLGILLDAPITQASLISQEHRLGRWFLAPEEDRQVLAWHHHGTRNSDASRQLASASKIGPTLASWMWNLELGHWAPWGPAVSVAAVEGESQATKAITRAEFVIHGGARLHPKVHTQSPYEGPRPDAAGSDGRVESESLTSISSIRPVSGVYDTVAEHGLITSLLWLFCGLYLLVLLITLLALFLQHRAILREVRRTSKGNDDMVYDSNFFHYCSYRFTQWFAWAEHAKSIVLVSLAFFFIMLGGMIYFIATGSGLGHSIWVIFCQLVEPDGGKTENTFEGQAVTGAFSVGGLIIFAVLIAFTQERFNTFLEHLRDGTEPVIEAGHVVIIGWTEQSLPLIKELSEAHSERGGCKIAVLSEIERMKIEEKVGELELGGSSVIIRTGRLHNSSALKLVGAHTCKTAIIMSDDRKPLDKRDAVALRVLLSLKSSIPFSGSILIHCARVKNQPLFEKLGGANTTVVTVEDFVARIIVQCSQDVGLSTVIKQTLGFGGAEFYILPAPPCVHNRHFSEALGYFPKAVLAGVVTEGTVTPLWGDAGEAPVAKRKFRWYKECMEMGHVLCATDEVVLFSDNDSDCRAEQVSDLQLAIARPDRTGRNEPDDGDQPMIQHVTSFGRHISFDRRPQCSHDLHRGSDMITVEEATSAEIVMILGWNEAIWHMIAELDNSVAHGSKVLILSQVPVKDREDFLAKQEKYFNRPLKNFVACNVIEGVGMTTDHTQLSGGVFMATGLTGSRFRLENFITEHAMPLDMVSRIFILTDQDPDGQHARDPDCSVISTVLHLREIFQGLHHTFSVPRQLGPTPTHKSRMSFTRPKQNIHEIPIIVEVREPETEEHCMHAQVLDFVDSVTMSAQVLAMVAYEPRMSAILHELISETGTMSFAIRDITEYLDPGEDPAEDVSFFDAMQLGLACEELVLGWSGRPGGGGEDEPHGSSPRRSTLIHAVSGLPSDFTESQAVCLSEQLQWEMNPPDKITPRPWRHGPGGDRLAVLCMRKRA